MLTTTPTTIAALQLDYASLLNIYPQLVNQGTANQQAELDTAIGLAVTAVSNLNSTIDGMMNSGDAGIVLEHFQVVVANALTNLQNAQTDE